MPKFYFTYGTDPAFPFQGGWTEIEAPDRVMAEGTFEAFHPCKRGSAYLECARVYTEDEFFQTKMSGPMGNFGVFCHERITLTRELIPQEGGGANADS